MSASAPLFRLLLTMLALAALVGGCVRSGAEPPIPAAPKRIGELQGSGERSPFEGQRLRIAGVVTGNFSGGLGGFFMQDAVGDDDGDPATSDGIFVEYARGSEPSVRRGDRVLVNGVVAERGPEGASMTVLAEAGIEVLGRGVAAAVALSEPPARVEDFERLEGMWLRIEAPLVVSGNGGLLRFGELVVAFGERLRVPTDLHPPGVDARALATEQARRSLTLDDARLGEFPERLWYLPEPLSAEAPLRAGSLLAGAEGVLEQRGGRWVLQLKRDLVINRQAQRPAMPSLRKGLRVMSFNVENFFNGDGRGGGFPTPRGAGSRADFERQRAKTVSVLFEARPDIVGLIEMENDGYGPRSALADLVGALNAALEAAGEEADYVFIRTSERPGGDAIKVGFAYRSGRVEARGEAALPDSPVFSRLHRPPVLQLFQSRDGGAPFSINVNHWKSKGGCEGAEGDNRDQGDGQSCWNGARVEAARALLQWLDSDPLGDGGRRLIMGDLNAYSQEDPIRLLRSAGYRDVLELGGRRGQFSYNFRGQAGSLDHGLASPALAADVRDAAIWGINADESQAFNYASHARNSAWYSADPFASSDHDPLILVLREAAQ